MSTKSSRLPRRLALSNSHIKEVRQIPQKKKVGRQSRDPMGQCGPPHSTDDAIKCQLLLAQPHALHSCISCWWWILYQIGWNCHPVKLGVQGTYSIIHDLQGSISARQRRRKIWIKVYPCDLHNGHRSVVVTKARTRLTRSIVVRGITTN